MEFNKSAIARFCLTAFPEVDAPQKLQTVMVQDMSTSDVILIASKPLTENVQGVLVSLDFDVTDSEEK